MYGMQLFFLCGEFRRVIWNFFRLENEHLNNVGNFRAVRDIFVTPIRKEDVKESDKATRTGLAIENIMTRMSTTILNNFSNATGDGGMADLGVSPVDCDIADEMNRAGPNTTPACIDSRRATVDLNAFHTNQKSLWRHLQDTYQRARNERKRRMGQEVVSNMEQALKEARELEKVSLFF